jgi:hypothetical protein
MYPHIMFINYLHKFNNFIESRQYNRNIYEMLAIKALSKLLWSPQCLPDVYSVYNTLHISTGSYKSCVEEKRVLNGTHKRVFVCLDVY